jgi:hypothetical protein
MGAEQVVLVTDFALTFPLSANMHNFELNLICLVRYSSSCIESLTYERFNLESTLFSFHSESLLSLPFPSVHNSKT